MSAIDDLALEIETQADQLFPDRTDTSMFLKIYGEVGELIEADDPASVEDEVADLLILLLDFASRRMFPIEKAIRRKMAINAQRNWKVNELGVMQHVK